MRKPKMEMSAVFTIGHTTRTRKEFLEILRAHRVKRVVDEPAYDRVKALATPEQEQMLERLSPQLAATDFNKPRWFMGAAATLRFGNLHHVRSYMRLETGRTY